MRVNFPAFLDPHFHEAGPKVKGVKTGIRTIAGYLTITVPIFETLHFNVKNREVIAIASGGIMINMMK